MYKEIFIHTLHLMEIIKKLDNIKIIFCKYGDHFEHYGLTDVSDLESSSLALKYNNGEYDEFYISNEIPKHSEDWDFCDRNEANILEINGGNLKKDYLEIAKIRCLAKKSNMNGVFKQIFKDINKHLTKDFLLSLNGKIYPKILIHSSSEGFKLVESFEKIEVNLFTRVGS